MNWQIVVDLTTWNGERITAKEEDAETTNFNISERQQSSQSSIPLIIWCIHWTKRGQSGNRAKWWIIYQNEYKEEEEE